MRRAIWLVCAVVAAACGSRSADVAGVDGGVFRRGFMVGGDGGQRPGSDAMLMPADARQEGATAVLGDARREGDVAVARDARPVDTIPVSEDTRTSGDAVPWGRTGDAGELYCPPEYQTKAKGRRGQDAGSELCYVPGVSSTCFRDLTGDLVAPCRYLDEVFVFDCSDCPRFYQDGGAR